MEGGLTRSPLPGGHWSPREKLTTLSGIEGLINEPENISFGCHQQQVALGSPATDAGWPP